MGHTVFFKHRGRGIDVSESYLSSQSHKPFESESSKIFRVESEQGSDKGGQCAGAALFGREALLVKRRNNKWSFTNEPEVRFRFRF